jgi:GIY-YIG catalytic domain-containing protein
MVLQEYRTKALRELTDHIGVYALCDLDKTPIYVGQSIDGIKARVRRHLTSARSDVIANRQLDVWEVAYVFAWPLPDRDKIPLLEAHFFHLFHSNCTLMNGSIPPEPPELDFDIPECQVVQILPDEEIINRKDPVRRLPRQAQHFASLVDHILNVKDSDELRRALGAHFDRLQKYHRAFLEAGG